MKRSCNFQWIGAVHEYVAVKEPILISDIAVTHKKERGYNDRNLKIFKSLLEKGENLSQGTYFIMAMNYFIMVDMMKQ